MVDDGSDWQIADDYLKQHPTRWGSLNWIATRPLLASLNDKINQFAGHLVGELRGHYVDRSPNPSLVIDMPGAHTFIVIGDTGEADGSQYVVAPALSRMARHYSPSFVTVNSDIIYPAGDVNEYVDAFYRPYRSTDNGSFSVYAPMFGQPGNHDWYGSNYGLMYHFCGQDKPDPAVYAPRGINPLQRLARILWRRPAGVHSEAARLRAETPPLYGGVTQPGPYFAVRMQEVLAVHIDTGIDGSIDPRQMAWLVGLNYYYPMPKVLVTGSPLVVDAKVHECPVVPADPSLPGSVWQLVHDPNARYVATMGGDIHNYQTYRPDNPPPGTPQVHVVCGGGGAYMKATHNIAFAANDARTDQTKWWGYPSDTFPTAQESFVFFANQLVPGIWRIFRTLLFFILGALTTSAVALFGDLVGTDAVAVVRWMAVAAVGALLIVMVFRMFLRRLSRSNWLKRVLVPISAYVIGLAAGSLGFQLDSQHYQGYLVLWLLITVWYLAVSWGISRSGWWLPTTDNPEDREVGRFPFYFGLSLLIAISVGVQLVFFRELGQIVLAAVAGGLLFLLFLIGRILRSRKWAAAFWRRRAAALAIGFLVLYFGTVIYQQAVADDLVGRFWLGLLGVLVLIGMLITVGLVMVVLTELFALPALPFGKWRSAWSAVARVVHYLPLVLFPAMLVGWAFLLEGTQELTTIAFPLAVVTFVGTVFVIDLVRSWLHTAYKPIMFVAVVGAGVVAYLFATPPIRLGVAAAIVVMAVLTTVVLAHLVFLGVLGILFDLPAHAGRMDFTTEDLNKIFAGATAQPRPTVPEVSKQVQRRARLTYRGVGEPGGPLQDGVSEIYALDEPPFFKQFLILYTSGGTLKILNHRVYGDRPPDQVNVGTYALV